MQQQLLRLWRASDYRCDRSGDSYRQNDAAAAYFTSDGTRVTHGFEIHCDVTDVPNNLEINWAPANNFHLEVLDTAVCTQTPAIQAPPNAPFDTFVGTGTGKLNGVPGASIEFTFVDGGEPGTKDTAKYLIKDSSGTVLSVGTTFLTKGNQQAHK